MHTILNPSEKETTMNHLTKTAQKTYPKPTLAKSNVGIGVPFLKGHMTAHSLAVFSCDTAPLCLMVGVVGVSKDTLFPLRQYANPMTPATLNLAFFGGRKLKFLIKGKPIMNKSSALNHTDIQALTLSSAMHELLILKSYLNSFANLTADTDDSLYLNASEFSLAIGDIANRIGDVHARLDDISLCISKDSPVIA